MAAVDLSYRALLYDLTTKSARPVFLVGEAFLTDLSVGGGPLPPGPGVPPTQPPIPGHPAHPIWGWPPVDPGYGVPGPPYPPSLTPPTPPNPGDPTTPVPPPPGSPGWPVQPVVPPPYIVVNYPGIGPVVVAPPASAAAPPDPNAPTVNPLGSRRSAS